MAKGIAGGAKGKMPPGKTPSRKRGKGVRASDFLKRPFFSIDTVNALDTSEMQSFRGVQGQMSGASVCSHLVLQTKDADGKHVFVGWHAFPAHVRWARGRDSDRRMAESWGKDPKLRRALQEDVKAHLREGRKMAKGLIERVPPDVLIRLVSEYLGGVRGKRAKIIATLIPGVIAVGTKATPARADYKSMPAIEKLHGTLNSYKHRGIIDSVRTRGLSESAKRKGSSELVLDHKTGRIHRVEIKGLFYD